MAHDSDKLGTPTRWGLVDAFVPAKLDAQRGRKGADELHRARLGIAGAFVGAIALAAFCAIHVIMGAMGMAVALGTAATMVACGPLILSRVGSVPISTNWSIAWTFAAIAYVVWVGGGLLSPALQFLSVLVLASVLIAGMRSGAFWAAASVAYVVALEVARQTGYELPQQVDSQHIEFMWTPTTAGILIVTLAMALLYERFKRTVLSVVEQTNAELEVARDAAEAAVRAKGSFLANVSHEIRTPMNAVIGMTGLLLREEQPPEHRQYLETIRSSGEHLLTLINDVLDFSKIEAGRLTLEEHRYDLRACAAECADLLALEAGRKQLELTVLVDPDAQRFVRGDVGRVRQVLVNLLSNAVKFTEQGEVAVRVGTTEAGRDRVDVTLEVRDTGVGISPEQAARLFEPFSQGDVSTTRKYGGTGLGLVISRKLCEAMGGTLTMTSEPGVGSSFTATFRVGVAQPPEEDPDARFAALRGKRALVLDDNPTNRLLMRRLLDGWGMSVIEAASGAQGLQCFDEGAVFDVAVIDFHMPAMDGLTFASRLKERWGSACPPLVMATSLGLEAAADRDVDALLTSTISKPIKVEQLGDALLVALGGVAPHTPPSEAAPTTPTQALRILVVEDNRVNQTVAVHMLDSLGHRADVAGDGLEALEALQRQRYDVVFMDVQMPNMDGLTASREIHRRWAPRERPRIIAMTANAQAEDRAACLEAGMDDYLSKPVRFEDLIELLSNP